MAKWLMVSDVVQLLHVPEATIYRWIRQGDIPCIVRRGKYYFKQSTLFSWAESKHIHLEEHLLNKQKRKQDVKTSQFLLVEALKAGKVFHDVPADSIEILFQEVSSRMELSRSVSDSLAEQLLQREKISSTGIGNGFAIPHPKTPLGQQITQSMVGAFFLRTPLDFKAPDGLPVFTAFVLLSTDSHHHLLLLSQLARLLGNSKLNELLNNSPSLEILVEQFEKTLAETA
jgi:PTS system nitrogen regulatory IIA component